MQQNGSVNMTYMVMGLGDLTLPASRISSGSTFPMDPLVQSPWPGLLSVLES